MAEDKDASQPSESSPPPYFLEVICNSSGKTRRFAPGVKAGFALSLINQKLDADSPLSMYIEAAKEGEEPIIFGPNSLLINYGEGWKLHTVVFSGGFYGMTTGDPDILVSILSAVSGNFDSVYKQDLDIEGQSSAYLALEVVELCEVHVVFLTWGTCNRNGL